MTDGISTARQIAGRAEVCSLAATPDRSQWCKFEGIELGNGDNIGVVTPWEWPSEIASSSRQAKLKLAGQKIVDAFWRLVQDGRTSSPPLPAGVHPGAAAVSDGELRKMAHRIGLVTVAKPEGDDKVALEKWQSAARQAWARGAKEVQERTLLRFEDGFWWDLRHRGGNAERVTSRGEGD